MFTHPKIHNRQPLLQIGNLPATFMRNDSLTAILTGILGISALAAVLLCYLYFTNIRNIRVLQSQMAQVQNNRALITALANDVVEYGKTHPDIGPILESVGFRSSKTAAAPAPKPTTPTR